MKGKSDMAEIVKLLGSIGIFLLVLFFAACEDSVSDSSSPEKQLGMEVVVSVKDLPKCTKQNNGELAWIKEENSARVCVDDKWRETVVPTKDTVFLTPDTLIISPDTVVLASDTVYLKENDFSCMTEELGDSSGLKIVCNGDSIGVLLNGENGSEGMQGERGEPGVGCNVTSQTDTSVTIACGKDTTAIRLETTAKPELYANFSQKGFFQKGTSVYIYELSDGQNLKMTGTVYPSELVSDDGRYKFVSRNLVSQYARLDFDGFYRNVVTGKISNAPIRLSMYTNMLMRWAASANVFTQLELKRVDSLVIHQEMTVRAAKKQALHEIVSLFYMDSTGIKSESEDLDLFGSDETDAMLLAATVLLQGNRNESEFKSLLTDISNAIIGNGEWKDSLKRMEIAAWARNADSTGLLDVIRENIVKNVNENIPDFREYVRNYWCTEYGMENCEEVQ